MEVLGGLKKLDSRTVTIPSRTDFYNNYNITFGFMSDSGVNLVFIKGEAQGIVSIETGGFIKVTASGQTDGFFLAKVASASYTNGSFASCYFNSAAFSNNFTSIDGRKNIITTSTHGGFNVLVVDKISLNVPMTVTITSYSFV